MKSSVATLFSIVGVAVSGAAAYSFNTVILSSPQTPTAFVEPYVPTTQNSYVLQSSTVPGGGVATQEGAVDSAGSVATETSIPFASQTEAATTLESRTLARQDQTVTYDLGRLGTITVREAGDVVGVVAAQSSWRVSSTSQGSKTSVRFVSSTEEYMFTISSSRGALTTTLAETTPARKTTTTVPRPRSEEREDEEDEEDEEHESSDGYEEERDD